MGRIKTLREESKVPSKETPNELNASRSFQKGEPCQAIPTEVMGKLGRGEVHLPVWWEQQNRNRFALLNEVNHGGGSVRKSVAVLSRQRLKRRMIRRHSVRPSTCQAVLAPPSGPDLHQLIESVDFY
jgi:hypothetical protein